MEDYPFSEKTRIIWKHFIRQFQEESIASYQSDFLEFTRFTKKDFLDIHAEDVAGFYRNLEKKIEEKTLAPSTCAKKIRELNSLSNYISKTGWNLVSAMIIRIILPIMSKKSRK